MRRECRERFPPPPRFSDPDMHHGTCVTHVPWCKSGSLTSDFIWNRWRGKRSRHSRCMRNLRFCVSGKRSIRAALCLNRDLWITQMFIMSLPLPVKCSATWVQHEIYTVLCQVATEYVYVCECICTCACICVHIYDCMHMYTCNKCVIENTTCCYICDKIQCDAVTARSVFSKHSHDKHTIARLTGEILGVFCELKVWFHIPYQLLQFCIQSEDNIRPRYDGTQMCTNCTAFNGKKFLLTSGKGNMYWQYCGEDAPKHCKGIENPRMFLHGYV